jgi:hypothetical protein
MKILIFTTSLTPEVILPVGSPPALFVEVLTLLSALSLFLASCAGETTLVPTPVSTPSTTIETTLTAAERAAIFEAAWQTVNDNYFDPTFGGVDWVAIGDEYRQKLATVQDDHTFWLQVLNPMLFELGVSHIGALPAELSTEIESKSFATGSSHRVRRKAN